jgi:histidinol-phosphate/aromatic aminotransferase/cobyric acid decarboxylase-like protein
MEEGKHKEPRIKISLAGAKDMGAVYRLRHEVYAEEIGQYTSTDDGILLDAPDLSCTYVIATLNDELVGMVGITPPESARYSVDKFLSREEVPFKFDETLYEIRALTVKQPYRGLTLAGALMIGAFRWIEAHGGKHIVSIGRNEVLDLYLKIGMKRQGKSFKCGEVQYELIGAELSDITARLNRFGSFLDRFEKQLNWKIGIAFRSPQKCYHGGAFFDGIGTRFDKLDRIDKIISADVLDAWFPPPLSAQEKLIKHLPWAMKTSPPTGSEGLEEIIAETRGVKPANIITGGGSSALIFLAFRHWLNASSRVLILNPSYGEYAHVLEKIVGCKVERFTLLRKDGYRIDLERLKQKLSEGFDLFVWVNPNSPTGLHVAREEVEAVVQTTEACKRIWIDETYIEYVGAENSLERLASRSDNVIVCKSMSKVYALSGMRVAYLCASPHHLEGLRIITPPWSVSLPAQLAATIAMQSADYYKGRYEETHQLRNRLIEGLRALGIGEIIPGVANFILFHLPENGPSARALVNNCRNKGLYLRDVAGMGTDMGSTGVRIAVKDAVTNARMLKILGEFIKRD